jgi:hypothetical protein
LVSHAPPQTRTGSTNDESVAVIAFALISRFAAFVLRVLISGNVIKRAVEERQRYLEGIDNLISQAVCRVINSLSQDRNSTPTLGKRTHPDHLEGQQWAQHCLCASLLRIWYDVLGEEKFHLNTSEVLSRSFSDILGFISEGVFPELQLEAVSFSL